MEDFFSDLTANRPYIHLVKEEGQEGFTAHLRHDISFGEEGALIRQAGPIEPFIFARAPTGLPSKKTARWYPIPNLARRTAPGAWRSLR